MLETQTDSDVFLIPLQADEIEAVAGAAIYVDGVYWSEGTLNLRPWPGGFPVHYK